MTIEARAIENQAFVAGVNRCGADPSIQYPGCSLIVGPSGELLAEAGDFPAMIGTDVDMNLLREYQRTFPVLDDK